MGTLTTNYLFQKSTVGGDPDTWGDDYASGDPLVDESPGLNGNWEKLDQLFKALEDRVAAAEQGLIDQQIKVGDLYLSTDADDPATKLGYGTWTPHAEGKALIGVGDNGETDWTVGLEGGSETHQLVQAELPAHVHGVGSLAVDQLTFRADFKIRKREGGDDLVTDGQRTTTSNDGSALQRVANATGNSGTRHQVNFNLDHSHTISGDTGSTGGGTPHSSLQPSIAVYVWRRTT